jgi:hypothetical protein
MRQKRPADFNCLRATCQVGRPFYSGGPLLSHTEADHTGCCATFGSGGSLESSRTFLANSRSKYFAIIARDGISGPLDVTQSACLRRLAFRTRWSRRAGWSRFACSALWARRSLLAGASLRTSWAGWTPRSLCPGWALRASGALWSRWSRRALAPFTSDQQDGGRECDYNAQSRQQGARQKLLHTYGSDLNQASTSFFA